MCEQDSANRTSYSVNLHRWKPAPHVSHGYKRITTPDLTAEFHVWGCEFTPKRIDYYFDGISSIARRDRHSAWPAEYLVDHFGGGWLGGARVS